MSLSGLTGALGNPTFTAWTEMLTNGEIPMGWINSFNTNSFACLYLETTYWENWINVSTPSADQESDLEKVLSVYDGYTRALFIATGKSDDSEFTDDTNFGACFYIEDDSISCVWANYNTGTYTTNQTYKNLYDGGYGDIVGAAASDYSDVT